MKLLRFLAPLALATVAACDTEQSTSEPPAPMVAPKPIPEEGTVPSDDIDTRDMEQPGARPADGQDAGVIRGQAHIPARGVIEPE